MRLRHLNNQQIKELPEQELIDLIRYNRYLTKELETLESSYELLLADSNKNLEELLEKWAKYNSATPEEVKSAYLELSTNKNSLRKCSKELDRVIKYREKLSDELAIRIHGE